MELLQGLLHLNQFLGTLIAEHGNLTYAVLFLVVFCEIGLLPLFFLPGDPLLFFCGAFCATGALSIWLLLPLLFAAAVLGSLLSYWLGRGVGEQAYLRNYRWLDRDALARAHAFYERYGRVTFLVGGYFFGNIPLIRDHIGAIVLLGLALGLSSLALGPVLRRARQADVMDEQS